MSQLDTLYSNLTELLNNPRITSCQNRTGLREASGLLLDNAYLDFAASLAPDLSVEIGAHEASFSSQMKHRCPEITALAFEANPYVYSKYVKMAADRLSGVKYINAAISDVEGTVDLYIPAMRDGQQFSLTNAISSLLPRSSDEFDYETVSVDALTLDDMSKEYDFQTAVAWIDVEGAHKAILDGGPEFFRRASAVHIEVETARVWDNQMVADEVTNSLSSYGMIPVMRDNLSGVQYNQVYINPDRVSDAQILTALEELIKGVTQAIAASG